ncbi:hypothetical protein AB0C93_12335 [Streptomyces sp. NPDC048518]|uniref:hypothetical protein n=1 Tax=Streptomyces sp. NPDC048518 TaxID=3155029 RepID=UPI0033C6C068
MGTAKHRLWFQLRGLHERARAARRAQGLPDSQAAMERELRARGPAAARGFSGKRISDWVPAEASRLAIPQARNDDRVVALAGLLAEWAGEAAPGRGLRDLLDEAREEQARERTREERGDGGAQPPTRDHPTVRDVTPWHLEVRRAQHPGAPDPTTAPLTPYLIRDHDHALRAHLKSALHGGTSVLGVLTGDSSTGKTRALYEAVLDVAPDHRLLRPTTARALLAQLADGEIGDGCVLWLNELQRILHDREGGDAASELAAVLQGRAGIVAVAALWEDPYWRDFTAQGRPGDPSRHTRTLLTGPHARRFRVPRTLTDTERARWRQLALDHGDFRLHTAGRAGAADGQVVQHLSGGPEMLADYRSGPGGHFTPREHALVTAALDTRRLGHQTPPSAPLLAAAADGTLAPYDRAPTVDWAGPELDALAGGVRGDGARRTLVPLSAVREFAGAPPRYEPADYLVQHAGPAHRSPAGSSALWEALVRHTADLEDLHRLQGAAWRRGLIGYALRLDRRAALAGAPDACTRVVERMAGHPDAAQAAAWAAAAHRDPSYGDATARLLAALHRSGFPAAVATLARRTVAATDPTDVRALAELTRLLAGYGVPDEVVAPLIDSLVAQVDRVDPDAVIWVLRELADSPAHRAVEPLAHHAATHATLTNGRNTAHSWRLGQLLRVLKEVGASDALDTLVARVVASAEHGLPDELPGLIDVLQRVGAEHAARTLLAQNPAARIGLTEADVVLRLLHVLREAGDDDGVRTLLDRSPARHVDVVGRPDLYDIGATLCLLLTELQNLGAEAEFALLAERVAAGVDVQGPDEVAAFLDLFHTAGRADCARRLLARAPMSGIDYYDPAELRPLLDVLLGTGATAEFDGLAACVAHDVEITNPDFVDEVVQVLWEAGEDRGIAPLMERALAHRPCEEMVFLAGSLRRAGAAEAGARLARHIAEHVENPDVNTMDLVLWALLRADAPDAVRVLLGRGHLDRLDVTDHKDWYTPADLIETLCELGEPEAAASIAEQAVATIELTDTHVGQLVATLTAHDLTGPRGDLVRRAATGAALTHMNSVARLIEAFLAAGETEAVDVLLRRDPLAYVDRGGATDSCHLALVTALRKAGSPRADEFARWSRLAGRLPDDPRLPYGSDLDGDPAAPWTWDHIVVADRHLT